ncbi:hypothetical protein PIB30_106341 [Stylosanthes scabra]|uniref:Uncharacterized protein n=1 Tax=Stylosanthes scabra TaxID=79078 RepID=A0ABU6U1W7_9FABA|nr:hypothetical protein [Stylosanthes scabra]
MLDLNRHPEGSSEGSIPFSNQPVAYVVDSHDESVVGDPTTHPYLLNNDSDNDDVDNEPAVLPQEEEEEDDEEEEEDVQGVNYFGQTQPVYAQPAISRPYDHPGHFRTLNLGAMDLGSHGFQGGPDDDPVDEFEVGQEFADKEAVVMAVKTYSIRRAVEYKILESDRLKCLWDPIHDIARDHASSRNNWISESRQSQMCPLVVPEEVLMKDNHYGIEDKHRRIQDIISKANNKTRRRVRKL